jgi:hypothetical protein
MTPDEMILLEAFRAVVRAELRRVGLRPPTPPGLGMWTWDAEADAWRAVDAKEDDA